MRTSRDKGINSLASGVFISSLWKTIFNRPSFWFYVRNSRNKEERKKRKSKDRVMYTKTVDFLTYYNKAIPILTEYETIIISQKKRLSPYVIQIVQKNYENGEGN